MAARGDCHHLQALGLRSCSACLLGPAGCTSGALTLATVGSLRRRGPEQLEAGPGSSSAPPWRSAARGSISGWWRKTGARRLPRHARPRVAQSAGPIVNATEMLRLRGTIRGAPTRRDRRAAVPATWRGCSRICSTSTDPPRQDRAAVQAGRVRELVRQVVDAARTLGGHEIETALPADPVWMEADPARLEQVLANLLHNAIKFTPTPGKIVVRLRPGSRDVLQGVRRGCRYPARPGVPHLRSLRAGGPLPGPLEGGLRDRPDPGAQPGGPARRRGEAHSEGPGRGSELVVHLPWQPGVEPSARHGRVPRPASRSGAARCSSSRTTRTPPRPSPSSSASEGDEALCGRGRPRAV